MLADQLPAKLADVFGFVLIKAGGVDQLFQSRQGFRIKIFESLEFGEQRWRNLVYLFVRALGAENYGDSQFVRLFVGQRGERRTELFF